LLFHTLRLRCPRFSMFSFSFMENSTGLVITGHGSLSYTRECFSWKWPPPRSTLLAICPCDHNSFGFNHRRSSKDSFPPEALIATSWRRYWVETAVAHTLGIVIITIRLVSLSAASTARSCVSSIVRLSTPLSTFFIPRFPSCRRENNPVIQATEVRDGLCSFPYGISGVDVSQWRSPQIVSVNTSAR
jgi:hypothetical protein